MRENGLMMQYFECFLNDDGGLWQALKADASHLKELGISSVWIPPCCKAIGTNDMGYGVYDVYDLGEFDQKNSIRTKYGTRQELHEAIAALHENGIQVYADIVINHKAGADETEKIRVVEVDPEDRKTFITEEYEIEAWTQFTFPGRKGKYSDYSWSWEHFSGTDFNNANGKQAIYLIQGENKNWMQGVSYEKGNYDYLMFADIDYNHPRVRDETFKWIDWFVSETKVDGLRLDAIKHINDWFMRDFINHIKETMRQDFFCVGEYWSPERSKLENYLRNTDYQISLFDVPLHYRFYQASLSGKDFDMRLIFDQTLVKEDPNIAVTFVDNHDSQPQESLQSFVAAWFKLMAYALILLRKDGYPVIFYGDYYGISGANPVTGRKDQLDMLMRIRRENSYGEQFDYFDHQNIVGWIRAGDEQHPHGCAVIMSAGDAGEKSMFVGEMHAGEVWANKMGFNQNKVTIDEKGQGVFMTDAGSVSVYVLENN